MPKIPTKIKRLENEISKLEEKVEELHKEMSEDDVCTSYVRLAELQSQVDDIEKQIEDKMNLWEELNSSLE